MKRLDGDDAALVSPRTRKTAARDIVQVCACGIRMWMDGSKNLCSAKRESVNELFSLCRSATLPAAILLTWPRHAIASYHSVLHHTTVF